MKNNTNIYTSEQVGFGHPDRFCDILTNTLRYEYLKQDPNARTAIEISVSHKSVHIFGEVTSSAKIDVEAIARKQLQDTYPDFASTYNVLIEINSQSPEIAAQVVEQKTIRAGDQGMTINGATADSPTLEPLTVYLSNEFSIRIEKEIRKNNHKDIKSDFKVQFSMNYDTREVIANLSIAHSSTWNKPEWLELFKNMCNEICMEVHVTLTTFHFNKNCDFTIFGPIGDSGLTGRKIIADHMGGVYRHGGGSPNGKDASKVDISGQLFARYVAKHIIKEGLATDCEIQLGWIIGDEGPTSIAVECFGTNTKPIDEIISFAKENFDFRVDSFIKLLDLRNPESLNPNKIKYGYYHDQTLPWEK